MKNAWFFGCSFTKCSEIGNPKQTWAYLVSKHLKCKCMNLGEGGSSNERILHKIWSTMGEIKSGDWVFIGYTNPSRVMIPLSKKPYMKSCNIPSLLNDRVYYKEITSRKQPILDYITDVIHPFEKSIEKYQIDIFNKTISYIKSKNVNVFFWDYTWWPEYQTLIEYSKGRLKDLHWSPNGNRDFSDKVISEISKGKNTLPKIKKII